MARKGNEFPKAKALRELSLEEMKTRLSVERRKLADITFKHRFFQLEHTADLKKTRRLIARLETLLAEKG